MRSRRLKPSRSRWAVGVVLCLVAVALMVVDLISFNKVVGFSAIVALAVGQVLSLSSGYRPSVGAPWLRFSRR